MTEENSQFIRPSNPTQTPLPPEARNDTPEARAIRFAVYRTLTQDIIDMSLKMSSSPALQEAFMNAMKANLAMTAGTEQCVLTFEGIAQDTVAAFIEEACFDIFAHAMHVRTLTMNKQFRSEIEKTAMYTFLTRVESAADDIAAARLVSATKAAQA